MLAEGELLGLCPGGHIMELLRPELDVEEVVSEALLGCAGSGLWPRRCF